MVSHHMSISFEVIYTYICQMNYQYLEEFAYDASSPNGIMFFCEISKVTKL